MEHSEFIFGDIVAKITLNYPRLNLSVTKKQLVNSHVAKVVLTSNDQLYLFGDRRFKLESIQYIIKIMNEATYIYRTISLDPASCNSGISPTLNEPIRSLAHSNSYYDFSMAISEYLSLTIIPLKGDDDFHERFLSNTSNQMLIQKYILLIAGGKVKSIACSENYVQIYTADIPHLVLVSNVSANELRNEIERVI